MWPLKHYDWPHTLPIDITTSGGSSESAYIDQIYPTLFLYTLQSPWWPSAYHCRHHSLPSGPQTLLKDIKATLVFLRLSLYTYIKSTLVDLVFSLQMWLFMLLVMYYVYSQFWLFLILGFEGRTLVGLDYRQLSNLPVLFTFRM